MIAFCSQNSEELNGSALILLLQGCLNEGLTLFPTFKLVPSNAKSRDR